MARPFSIRLSTAERQRLEEEAGSLALGTYVRARLLNSVAQRRRSESTRDTTILSQLLGQLGRLQWSSSLSDLAIAARIGAVTMTPDLEQKVQTACRDVRAMRSMLIQALGLKPDARA